MTDRVDIVVIGAGVIGLAIARVLALHGREVVVLEAQGAIGTGISARNSEVIHAGLYYPPGSAMARLCVRGRDLLYDYCATHHIAHRRCGKLIVATRADDESRLTDIATRARQNGVTDVVMLNQSEARALEPELVCSAALLSPSTGIFDSHAYMLAMRGEAEAHGAAFAFHAPAERITRDSDGFTIHVGGEQSATLACTHLVNAAGLNAPLIAQIIDAMPREAIPPRYFARGNYFALTCRAPFSHLIYPVPQAGVNAGGLGVHLTLDLGGAARFGPDIEWIEDENYDVDPARATLFYPAIRTYWPGLPDGALAPAYAGVRPKIVPPSIAMQDFVIQGEATHGVRGLINLFGIESPGLTASLALADEAVTLI